jgi:hypothetical protein
MGILVMMLAFTKDGDRLDATNTVDTDNRYYFAELRHAPGL